jgi:hypothetical protein
MSASLKNLLRFLCASAIIVLALAALNFIVDPLQLLRPARWFVPMYSPDSRMQDAGLIRSQDFDSVFMGTSLAIHFRQSDIDRTLGVRSLKLAMTGSDSHEQSFVLATAMERHPKRVIWQIDDWIFRDAPDIDADIYLPADLYRRSAKGIAGYIFSGAMARESAWILARSTPLMEKTVARLTSGVLVKFPIPHVDDINALASTLDQSELYNAKKAVGSFTRITDPAYRAYLAQGYDYDAMVRNFNRDALDLIRSNPDVEFVVYFPPYSILQWVAMRDASPATLKIVYDFSSYASQRLVELANVRLYDFREAKEITHDLSNYADVVHHSPTIDLKVLSYLAAGNYAVSREAPTAAIERLKAQVEAYDAKGIER